jgi:hypothetical protein
VNHPTSWLDLIGTTLSMLFMLAVLWLFFGRD